MDHVCFLGYFVVGVLISLAFALKRRNAKSTSEELNPVTFLADPLSGGWLRFIFWPAWLVIMLLDRKGAAKAAPQEYLTDELVGKTGVVVLEPKPIGRVQVADRLYDVTSPQNYLPVDSNVVITGRKLGELTVVPANTPKVSYGYAA